ncbi:DUF4232 domain-containing protein [Streptomyces violaceusniger]|uniref:DUF4232 domain-containing protein n=1 Tax=Streptomyces violaceusniger (strain Tu 4113) TaxID=653045 RepID=G2PB56_STRV4|nr:DUF4232 domain-containing protein [Streptomyces violaceusniger]AEM80108.1 hypothetical protein Strvi_0320 [Streptomyces violaceusniger Tu 4113]
MPLTTARLAHRAGTLRSVAAGLTIVAAGITLAACGTADASGVKTAGKAESMASAVPTVHEDGLQGGAQQAARETVAGGADAGAQGGLRADSGVEGETGVCRLDTMSVSVTSVPRPANHLLLEITNQSGVTCRLIGSPVARFDDGRAAVPQDGDTRPQTVVTLPPGESGYAGLTTSAADAPADGGRKATGLTVSLPGEDSRRAVDLPGDSVEVGDGTEVGYWQSDASDALLW